VDTDVINKEIAEAQNIIDSFVGVRFETPLASPSGRIKTLTIDLTIYRLFLRRGRVSDARQRTYDEAMKALERFAKGQEMLGLDPPPTSSTQGSYAEVFGPERVFSRNTLESF